MGKTERAQIVQISIECDAGQRLLADVEISQRCEPWGYAVVGEQVRAQPQKMQVRQIGRKLDPGKSVETEFKVGQTSQVRWQIYVRELIEGKVEFLQIYHSCGQSKIGEQI